MSNGFIRMVAALSVLATLVALGGPTAVGSSTEEPGQASTSSTQAVLGTELEALLAQVPESHRELCRPNLSNADEHTVMTVQCELPDGLTVYYSQLDSAEAVADEYQRRLDLNSIERDTGQCSEALPAELPYTVDDEPAGRLLCYESFGLDAFEWSSDDSAIYAKALLTDDPARLWTWWLSESGPIEPAADSPGSGLGAALDALVMQVPENHRATCRPFYGGGPEDGVVVSLKCVAASDLTVYYNQLDSVEALEAAYRSELENTGITQDTGRCSTAVPAELPYSIADEPTGRLFCIEDRLVDGTQFTWTHEPTLIKATAFSERDVTDTWQWWTTESGPIG